MSPMGTKAEDESFQREVAKKKLLGGATITLKVASDSMVPLLKVGEEIQVKGRKELSDYHLFDVVLFEQGSRFNAHFLTKADHNNQIYLTRSLKNPSSHDYPLKPHQLLGVVINKKISLWQKLKVLLVS